MEKSYNILERRWRDGEFARKSLLNNQIRDALLRLFFNV
jgi:hypothetical protein